MEKKMKRVQICGLETWVFGDDNGEKPIVFFLHGLTGSVQNSLQYCRELAEAGYLAIAIDQRNHGNRLVELVSNQSGSHNYLYNTYSFYTGTAIDISHIIDFIPIVLNVIPTEFITVGFSLGAHAALVAATLDNRITKSIAICGTGDRQTMISKRRQEKGDDENSISAEFTPQFQQVLDKYDPINNLQKLTNTKILLLHGNGDNIVTPYSNQKLLTTYQKQFPTRDNITLEIHPANRHKITSGMWQRTLEFLKRD